MDEARCLSWWWHERAQDEALPDHLLTAETLSREAFERSGLADARALSHLLEMVGRRGLTVIDYGCGPGRVAKHLVAWCGDYLRRLVMVDIAPAMLQRAMRRCGKRPPFEYVQAHPLFGPDLPDGCADFVACGRLLHRVDRQHAALLLKRVRRLLKPDGLCWVRFAQWDALGHANAAAKIGQPGGGARTRYWAWGEASALLLHLGFSIVAAKPDGIQALLRPASTMDWPEALP
jgi:SAM-dependent methyltransferase